MIHELRTYTLKPGAHPVVAKTSAELGRDIRGDEYGRLEGYWWTEFGALNQVVHLWSYDGLDERQRKRNALSQNERWTGEYLPKLRPLLVRQDIRLMHPIKALGSVETTGNVYEYRYYRTAPGRAREWLAGYMDVMPTREKYSPNVGVWLTEAGQPNEVSHMWVYPDLNARAQVRADLAEDSHWRQFLKDCGPLLEEMHNKVLMPASHSRLG